MNELIDNESKQENIANELNDNTANSNENSYKRDASHLKPYQFKPGIAPNPTGRPKMPEEFRQFLQQNAHDKLKYMFDRFASYKPQIQIELVKIALDRYYGKPMIDTNEIKPNTTIAIIEINRNDKQEDSIKTIEAQVEDNSKHNDT